MSSAALKIKIFDSKGTHLVPIAKSTATVGSASHCDVVLSHNSVQPEHVRAWCEGGRIWVQDLGTTGGTTLNGVRLPPLKPMLVRELDILKLGECPATMGLEPNLVRAPVVRPQAVPEFTLTDIRPAGAGESSSEKRPDDGERASRELADLKLQLQMARLEKDSGEDLRKELAGAKEEVARLTAEKQKLKDSFQHFEGDKKSFKKQMENEVADLKLKALRELKEQREEDARRFEHWKSEAVAQLASGLRSLSDQKVKTWNTRPLSKDMIFEWEADLNQLFKRVMLNERRDGEAPPPPVSPNTHSSYKINVSTGTGSKVLLPDEATVIRPMPPPAAAASAMTGSHTASATSSRVNIKKKSRRQQGEGPWQRIAIGGFVLALLMAVAWFASSYWKKDGARSMASQIETAPPPPPQQQQAQQPQQLSPPQAQAPAPQASVRPQPVEPAQTRAFKKSYTDNVLYTINYIDAELNMDFRAVWLKDLGRAVTRDWKMTEKTVASIAGKEILLLQDLKRLRAGMARGPQAQVIEQMRQREATYMRDLQAILGRKVTTDKFMRVKRAFYTRNQVYLAREKR